MTKKLRDILTWPRQVKFTLKDYSKGEYVIRRTIEYQNGKLESEEYIIEAEGPVEAFAIACRMAAPLD